MFQIIYLLIIKKLRTIKTKVNQTLLNVLALSCFKCLCNCCWMQFNFATLSGKVNIIIAKKMHQNIYLYMNSTERKASKTLLENERKKNICIILFLNIYTVYIMCTYKLLIKDLLHCVS